MDLEKLNATHSTPGTIFFDAGQGGLTRATLKSPSAQAEVYLHGAHVTYYARTGERPILWMSEKSLFAPDKAIRGGVPLVFPWFGPRTDAKPGPVHGFVRLSEWSVESATADADAVTLVLTLADDVKTQTDWPHTFKARYTVRVADTLGLILEVRNTGGQPFEFEEAFHTYLAVSDVREISITGLERTNYLDKVGPVQWREQGGDPIHFTGETDRVYQDTTTPCVVHDPAGARDITVEKTNSHSTVIWNPWTEKAKAMPDMADDEWPHMVCVETANALDARIKLAPGDVHEMKAVIR